MAPRTVLALALGLAVAGAVGAERGAPAGAAACRGGNLAGSFSVVRGSPGAGQISYRLRLRNRSLRTCFVSGLPSFRLLDRAGRPLPTRLLPEHPGEATAVLVPLRPGAAAAATARFSPDVPGVGEQVAGPCERTAYALTVAARGGGSTRVGIVPSTPVCEHGRVTLSLYRAA